MKNYLFFSTLITFLTTISSCTSNEEIAEYDHPLVDLLVEQNTSINNNEERIGKLEEEIEALKRIIEKVDTIEKTIEDLNKESTSYVQQLVQFKIEIEKVKNDISVGETLLNSIDTSLTNLKNQIKDYMEENHIFYGEMRCKTYVII